MLTTDASSTDASPGMIRSCKESSGAARQGRIVLSLEKRREGMEMMGSASGIRIGGRSIWGCVSGRGKISTNIVVQIIHTKMITNYDDGKAKSKLNAIMFFRSAGQCYGPSDCLENEKCVNTYKKRKVLQH